MTASLADPRKGNEDEPYTKELIRLKYPFLNYATVFMPSERQKDWAKHELSRCRQAGLGMLMVKDKAMQVLNETLGMVNVELREIKALLNDNGEKRRTGGCSGKRKSDMWEA